MAPEIIMPAVMGCALLWWIGRGMSWPQRFAIAAVTLAVIVVVLLVERGIG